MAFLDENGVAQLWDAVKDRLSGAFDSVEFNVAQQAANLVSGDSIATAFGKLAKNYTSLVDQISNLSTNKFDKNKVVANYTTQGTGYALDASLGPAIKTKMDLADTLNTQLSSLKSNMKYYSATTNGAQNVTFAGNTAQIPGVQLTLDPGIYVLMGNAYFQGCDAGRQGITMTMDNTPGANSAFAYELRAHDSATPNNLYYNICNPLQLTSRSTIYLMGYDSRNSVVPCGAKLCAVRLI